MKEMETSEEIIERHIQGYKDIERELLLLGHTEDSSIIVNIQSQRIALENVLGEIFDTY